MKVKDVMSRNCTFITPQTTLNEAARIMADQDIGFVPVAEADRMIGMVTDRDIVIRGVAKGADPGSPVSEVMTSKTYYCFDDDSAEDVCANMAEIKVRRLPVVNRDKRLIGVVSLGDLSQDVNKIKVGQTMQSITDPANDKKAA
jgi:CBS domain-containing protein